MLIKKISLQSKLSSQFVKNSNTQHFDISFWYLRTADLPAQSTSEGYWQGYAKNFALELNSSPSGHSFCSGTPSTHSMYASHWLGTANLPFLSGHPAPDCPSTEKETVEFYLCETYIHFWYVSCIDRLQWFWLNVSLLFWGECYSVRIILSKKKIKVQTNIC